MWTAWTRRLRLLLIGGRTEDGCVGIRGEGDGSHHSRTNTSMRPLRSALKESIPVIYLVVEDNMSLSG